MLIISRRSILKLFISLAGVYVPEHNMLNYSVNVNTSGVIQAAGTKSMVELQSVFYVVGIIGSSLALLHLHQKQSFKNTKQIFMLK